MSLDKKNSINNILEEKRIFPPSKEFAENANIRSQEELLSLKKQVTFFSRTKNQEKKLN